jgi:hypothetical protein
MAQSPPVYKFRKNCTGQNHFEQARHSERSEESLVRLIIIPARWGFLVAKRRMYPSALGMTADNGQDTVGQHKFNKKAFWESP